MARKKRSSFDAGAGAGDLFLCFTSKPSLSPGRRPLRGAQSPMFPSGRRKAPSFDAPVEPSSPKVTCIGQVRVKSKKKRAAEAAAAAAAASRSKSVRSRSRSRSSFGDSSFRRGEDLVGRNQKWGLNCLFLCGAGERRGERRSWVGEESVAERELEVMVKERVCHEVVEEEIEVPKRNEVVKSREEKEEEEGEEKEEGRISICIPPPNALLLMRCRSDPVRMAALASRFWESPAVNGRVEEEIVGEEMNDFGEEVEGEFEAEVTSNGSRDEGVGEHQIESVVGEGFEVSGLAGESDNLLEEGILEEQESVANEDLDVKEGALVDSSDVQGMSVLENKRGVVDYVAESGVQHEKKPKEMRNDSCLLEQGEEEAIKGRRSSSCSSNDVKEGRRSFKWHTKLRESGRRRSLSSQENKDKRRHSFSNEKEARRSSFTNDLEGRRSSFCIERSRSSRRWSFCLESEDLRHEKIAIKEEKKMKAQEEQDTTMAKGSEKAIEEVQNVLATDESTNMTVVEDKKEEIVDEDRKETVGKPQVCFEKEAEKSGGLPDCLLLMMYEPKLSMEVSKETWVCSNDFLRWRPNHHQYRPCQPSGGSKTNDQGVGKGDMDKSKMEVKSKDVEARKNGCTENKQTNMPVHAAPKTPPTPPQPLPLPSASVVEKKLKTKTKMKRNVEIVPAPPALPCGALVLTRCKSEPMRSSERLIPDACFWKDRHRPIGATGIGF